MNNIDLEIFSAIPDMKYKFSAVVRKRDERDKLDGYACAECAAVSKFMCILYSSEGSKSPITSLTYFNKI